jgi:centromeric protein E
MYLGSSRVRKGKEGNISFDAVLLETYNETVFDLLVPPSVGGENQVGIQEVGTNDIILGPLREEVFTSLKGVKDVLKRGEGTASIGWNERSSRSHSIFRLVIESREHGSGMQDEGSGSVPPMPVSRYTRSRRLPSSRWRISPTGCLSARLQGKAVQCSALSSGVSLSISRWTE